MYSLTHLLLLQLSLLAAAAAAVAEPWPQVPATPISCEALLPLAHELVLAFCVGAETDAGGLSTPRQRQLCDRARRQLGYTGGVEPSKPAWNLYNLIRPLSQPSPPRNIRLEMPTTLLTKMPMLTKPLIRTKRQICRVAEEF